MKKKLIQSFFLFFILYLSSGGVYAKDPCGSVLCLSGMLTGDNPSMCKQHVKDYFSIRKYKRGKWRIGKTIKKRYKYLSKCPEGKTKIALINATYGHIYGM